MNRRPTIERRFEAVLVAYPLSAELFLPAGSPLDTGVVIGSIAGLSISESPIVRSLKVSRVFTTFFLKTSQSGKRICPVADSATDVLLKLRRATHVPAKMSFTKPRFAHRFR